MDKQLEQIQKIVFNYFKDVDVQVEKVLTREEIITLAESQKESEEYFELCKSVVKRIPGYAVASTCNNTSKNKCATGSEITVEHNEIVKYSKL